MNRMIKKALICLLNNEVVVCSWGLTNININESSIEFDVFGFLYQGNVKISPIEFGYRIDLGNNVFIESSLEDLVYKIDTLVEKSDNYENDLRDWILHK